MVTPCVLARASASHGSMLVEVRGLGGAVTRVPPAASCVFIYLSALCMYHRWEAVWVRAR